ncbi:MAG: biotin/lipoyl-binding protein, partial [Deltaproteobacteria bacterium]
MDKKVKMRYAVVILIVLILVLIAVVFGKFTAPKGHRVQQASAVRVEVMEVKRERIPDALTFTGDLQPDQRATITANVSGILELMQVKEGDNVEEGAVLAQVEQEDYLLAL